MGKFIKIENEAMTRALSETTRQYYVGRLTRPQIIEFIHDDRLEIGISSYCEHTYEPTHKHEIATEYQYLISGWTEYMDTDTDEVFEFKAGDFYAILPGTAYAQKVKAGTSILFIKTPSINDKQLVEISPEQTAWLTTKLKTIRKDFYYADTAPKPNSIKPAAAVAIFNDQNEILMLHRADNNKWTMPGGTLEFGESLIECAIREVHEETGLDVVVQDIIGTYTNPNILVAYSDGEVRQEFTIVYYAEVNSDAVTLDSESSEYKWVSLQEVVSLPLADSQKRRLTDVVTYKNTGKKVLG